MSASLPHDPPARPEPRVGRGRTVVRTVVALAAASMGVINLLSAWPSDPPERLRALERLVPTGVIEPSRTFTLIAGVLLLITAWGLRRGKHRAYLAALLLCAVSVPFNLLHALDVGEATVASALLFVLGASADAFRVRSGPMTLAGARSRVLWFALALLVYAIAGCWWLEFLYAPADASLLRALSEAAFRLFGIGDSVLNVPPHHPVVHWFLHSIPVVGGAAVVAFMLTLLRPAVHQRRHREQASRVEALAKRYGVSSVVSFALDDQTDYFFSANDRAVIAYVFAHDTLLTIGDPIGPEEEFPALLDAFERMCLENDWSFAFYQARPERVPVYHARGWQITHIGEDPVLWADRFTLEGSALATLRRAVRKPEKQGIEARLFVPGENPLTASGDRDGTIAELAEISAEWLRRHKEGEKGFCMGRFEPQHLDRVLVAVAWNPAARRVEAFATCVPVWGRNGWMLDLMRRRDDGVSGATEYLIVRIMDRLRARGDAMLSLSLSALAKVEPDGSIEEPPAAPGEARSVAREPSAPNAIAPDRAREFLIERLARFYDFRGLFQWKKKFAPQFEDRYLVYPSALALPRIALALVRAQTPGSLLDYLRRER
jgi:phosphatidylglycerol lysyltransferase